MLAQTKQESKVRGRLIHTPSRPIILVGERKTATAANTGRANTMSTTKALTLMRDR